MVETWQQANVMKIGFSLFLLNLVAAASFSLAQRQPPLATTYEHWTLTGSIQSSDI